MSQDRFDIYFAGELLPDQDPQAVKQWLSSQFKLQGPALEKLFSGQPVRIKQGVDLDSAGRFRAAFRKAGALLEVRPAVASASTPQASPDAAASTAPHETTDEPNLLPAHTGSLEDCALPVNPSPLPNIDHMDLAPPDRPLDESTPAEAADIDTSRLSALPANSGDLSDCVANKVIKPLPDISQLQLTDD